MRLLVLGGTVFLGRHLVADALERGHDVTLFTRGRHNADLFPRAERRVGDRSSDLTALETGEWDAVVDTSGFEPSVVEASANLLRGRVGQYVFVSSASVYRDWPAVGPDESSPVWPADGEPHYGWKKARAEEAVTEAFPDASMLVRSGLLVGPHENIGRLPYWVARVSRHDRVLAPGSPGREIQVIDARDLAAWMLDAAERGLTGTFNATGHPGRHTMHDLLGACLRATGSNAELVWVVQDRVLAAGIEPWTELPIWLPDDAENRGGHSIKVDRALAEGLSPRPLAETVEDTWAWLQASGGETGPRYAEHQAAETLSREREEALLAEFPP